MGDLYSEIGAITRASKVDFEELCSNISTLQKDCKSSWDHLKAIAKHDGPTQMKLKMSEFLADCAERIIMMGIIYRRVMTRVHRFLMWLGTPSHAAKDANVQTVCSTVSEFSLEYRTCRERVLQQLQKKAAHRERNKTRGKMIIEEDIDLEELDVEYGKEVAHLQKSRMRKGAPAQVVKSRSGKELDVRHR